MKSTKREIAVTLGICFFCFISVAHAEKFVEVFFDEEREMFANVDVDSIRKSDDGLVYFTVDADIGRSAEAVNCQKRISYLLEQMSMPWKNPDWINKGSEILPGSNGARILEFVCARVR